MPIDTETLKKFTYNKVFVETGTSNGVGLQAAYDAGFERLFSIEFYSAKYDKCWERFKDKRNIILMCGNSGEVLQEILDVINESVTFWLDSHYSGPGKYHPKPLADTCPILKELDCIQKHHINTHTILIDDMRIFRKSISLWNNINEDNIINILMSINKDYTLYYIDGVSTEQTFKKDILVAEIK